VESTSYQTASPGEPPDLFRKESEALEKARLISADPAAVAGSYHEALAELIVHYERLMRETRRLIGRSDRAEREMQVLTQQLQYRAAHDALTGVFNRSEVIEQTIKTLRFNRAVMILLDIDEFKKVNDDYGHPAGDTVIVGIVNCLRTALGNKGFIGRVGGEEFTVVLPGIDFAGAMEVAEGMREQIAAHRFPAPVSRRVTASFGLSDNAVGTDFDTAYGLADAALYAAKRGGRNRVAFSGSEEAAE